MVVLGILLVLAGLLSGLVLDNSMDIGSIHNVDMNQLGWILFGVGAASILFGLWVNLMYTNTSHVEEHDVLVDKVPGEEPRKIVRRRKRPPVV